MTKPEPLRVLIDTDPGLDDAIAILYALAERRFVIEAITTVAGNIGIETTTRNGGRLLAAMGRGDIVYAAGAAGPLLGQGIDEEAIHGADGLGGVVLPKALAAPCASTATELSATRLLAGDHGALSVLALGPLTNLAQLLRDAPQAFKRVRRIIAMGGTIFEPGNAGDHAEFNIAADPHAARMVFNAGVPVTLIPLDVTRKLRANPEDLERLAASGTVAARLSAKLIGAYFADNTSRQSRPLHDPCVMLMARAPHLFGIETMRIAVDCDTQRGRLIQAPGGAVIEVAMTIDAQGALDALWGGLSG
jgi:purine nucleosidase/pyrimidine-specific ribonucleoside hydrolase